MKEKKYEKASPMTILFGIVAMAAVIFFLIIPSMPKDEAEGISGKHYVEMSIKDYGVLQIELDADVAPITVDNFLGLVGEGFYDGLTFHRVYAGFMIQGGDPYGDGQGGSGQVIKGEFSANGVENNLSHTRGVISMARKPTGYDSASSQFFICHADSEFLDGNYAAFGRVLEGMEVVDAICDTVKPYDENGSVNAGDQPVIEYIKIIEK